MWPSLVPYVGKFQKACKISLKVSDFLVKGMQCNGPVVA
jgi:hypothetical protein